MHFVTNLSKHKQGIRTGISFIDTASVLHHRHKEITAVNKQQSKVERDAFEWLLHNLKYIILIA